MKNFGRKSASDTKVSVQNLNQIRYKTAEIQILGKNQDAEKM